MIKQAIQMNKKLLKERGPYIAPRIQCTWIEFEQSIAAGSANINSGSDSSNSQEPSERQWESGWSNNKDFDI